MVHFLTYTYELKLLLKHNICKFIYVRECAIKKLRNLIIIIYYDVKLLNFM